MYWANLGGGEHSYSQLHALSSKLLADNFPRCPRDRRPGWDVLRYNKTRETEIDLQCHAYITTVSRGAHSSELNAGRSVANTTVLVRNHKCFQTESC